MTLAGDARLWEAAGTLGRTRVHGKALPVVWFVTDPDRTPDPVAIAERLPAGVGVIYRHFGRPDAEALGRRLSETATRRRLVLLVGADADLAAELGAAGVHLPERSIASAGALKVRRPDWIVTAAAHSEAAARTAFTTGADAAFLSPIFESQSPSAGTPLGAERLAEMVRQAHGPIYALGGVNADTVQGLIGKGVAGFAAVEAFTWGVDPRT